eukprot:m.223780 g.223780  ORF g.223780 m.223780 type:complete len:191 (-) comp16324_c0_seq1:266-838(-)
MLLEKNKQGAFVALGVLYGTLFAFGALFKLLLGTPVLLVPFAYYLTGIIAFTTHVLGHYRISERWFTAHTIGHHVHAYPPTRFVSDGFVNSPDPNDKFYGPAIFGPAVAAVVLGFGLSVGLVMAFTGGTAAWVADYVHTGLHLKEFWMDRFALFRELRRLHVFHHKGNFRTNYGIYDFSFDILWGSMRYA